MVDSTYSSLRSALLSELTTQSAEDLRWIAYKSTIQAFPLAMASESDRWNEQLALLCARSLLMAGLAQENASTDFVDLCEKIATSITRSLNQVISKAYGAYSEILPDHGFAYACDAAAGAVAIVHKADANIALCCAEATSAAFASTAHSGSGDSISDRSIHYPGSLDYLHSLLSLSSFPFAQFQGEADRHLSGSRLCDPDSPWTFWERYYRSVVLGEPLPKEIRTAVALIPDDIWEAGPEAVSEEIARIEARFAVLSKIEEIEDGSGANLDTRFGICGNCPPEPTGLNSDAVQQVTAIWNAIRTLHNQASSSEPNAESIEEAIEALNAGYMLLQTRDYSPAEVVGLAIFANAAFGLSVWLLNPANIRVLTSLAQDWLKLLT
ncbi:hypothetical protein [Hasllibacter sp. MH4015]|uniref:hypothetical protein n=1 Tax=Hasllibacter sp. MH4015 TaxID=2854029 RepID=UPI001CD77C80|nr:hypothetical protein [Hasllibacter sp. MH4015]